MKFKYIAILVLIFLIALLFEYQLLASPMGENPRIANAIQAAAVFMALFAAVVAVAGSDPTPKQVKVLIESYLSRDHVRTHNLTELPEETRSIFSHYPEKFESNQVQFRMVNQSGFTLIGPTIAFRLPRNRRHPHLVDGRYVATFNSNLFNSMDDVKILEFAGTQILSSKNLPYWNHQEELVIWIRMTLVSQNFDAFDIEASVNAENAQGVTRKVTVSPKVQQQ